MPHKVRDKPSAEGATRYQPWATPRVPCANCKTGGPKARPNSVNSPRYDCPGVRLGLSTFCRVEHEPKRIDRASSPWAYFDGLDPGRCPGLVSRAPLALGFVLCTNLVAECRDYSLPAIAQPPQRRGPVVGDPGCAMDGHQGSLLISKERVGVGHLSLGLVLCTRLGPHLRSWVWIVGRGIILI